MMNYYPTRKNFQYWNSLDEGTHDLRLTVVDDDGATDTYNFEIIIKSKNSESDINYYGAVFALIAIVLLSIFMIKRMQTGDLETKSLPKWNQNNSKQAIESDNSKMEKTSCGTNLFKLAMGITEYSLGLQRGMWDVSLEAVGPNLPR